MANKAPFYKSSVFWNHLATSAAGVSVTLTGMFDQNFVHNHPTLSVVLTVVGIIGTAISSASYNIARSITPVTTAPTPAVVPDGGIA